MVPEPVMEDLPLVGRDLIDTKLIDTAGIFLLGLHVL
jgi:hypothetical protein